MNITIKFNGNEAVHLTFSQSIGPVPPVPKIGSINLNSEDDSEFLPLDHYDKAAISDFLKSEMKHCPALTPRMPRSVTGLFRESGYKHLALSDEDGELLAVYRIHSDGSMTRIHRVPQAIIAAYN